MARGRCLPLLFLSLCASCANPGDGGALSGVRFTFAVADVGQGLAHFGAAGNRAVIWDVGPDTSYHKWYAAYAGLGSPRIEAAAISHSHNDHYGALKFFDGRVDWGGEIIVSPYEDTAGLRENVSALWRPKVKFNFCARGDTLRALGPVEIVCLWPPKGLDIATPVEDDLKNRYSLVFSVRHNGARALITSDIDSAAMEEIAAHSEYGLRAQILSVPHHGSKGSVNPLFFAYVKPETAVISCARQNTYGHPSVEMVDELTNRWGVNILYTFIPEDRAVFVSNGYYWER
jgi:competence protein ComEC